MTDDQLRVAQNIIRQDPSLIWYTKAYDQLDERSIVEAVLNYGSWEQVQQLIKIMGIEQVARVFDWHNAQMRCNLHPIARNYFALYFARHAPRHSNNRTS